MCAEDTPIKNLLFFATYQFLRRAAQYQHRGRPDLYRPWGQAAKRANSHLITPFLRGTTGTSLYPTPARGVHASVSQINPITRALFPSILSLCFNFLFTQHCHTHTSPLPTMAQQAPTPKPVADPRHAHSNPLFSRPLPLSRFNLGARRSRVHNQAWLKVGALSGTPGTLLSCLLSCRSFCFP